MLNIKIMFLCLLPEISIVTTTLHMKRVCQVGCLMQCERVYAIGCKGGGGQLIFTSTNSIHLIECIELLFLD